LSCRKAEKPISTLKTELVGIVEKGPFLKGSNVTIAELDNDLNPTGRVFNTEITDDFGHFEFKNLELLSRYVQITVDGYYFDEVRGRLSNSRIVLGALADVQKQQTVNVNVITHLEQRRVKFLVERGESFVAAKRIASSEILRAFYLDNQLDSNSETISITDNNRNSFSLVVVSSTLLNMTFSDAQLTEMISTLSQQFELNGDLDEVHKSLILESLKSVDFELIKQNIITRYQNLGLDIEIPFYPLNLPSSSDENETIPSEEEFNEAYIKARTAFLEYYQLYTVFEASYTNSIDVKNTPKYQDISMHQVHPDNPQILELWKKAYGVWHMFADVIEKGKHYNFSNADEVESSSTVYCSFLCWTMMNVWGDVPYLDPQTIQDGNYSIPRTQVSELVNILRPKLHEVIQNIQQIPTSYEISQAFPLAIAARISTLVEDYAAAESYLFQIIQSGEFDLGKNPWAESERICGVSLAEFPSAVNADYRNLINNGISVSYVTYTEILLAAAEANLKLGLTDRAAGYLNQIRQRRGKPILNTNDPDEIAEAILRQIEDDLNKDGVLFAYWKRNGQAEAKMGIPAFRKLLPIPLIQLNVNPLITQNFGY